MEAHQQDSLDGTEVLATAEGDIRCETGTDTQVCVEQMSAVERAAYESILEKERLDWTDSIGFGD